MRIFLIETAAAAAAGIALTSTMGDVPEGDRIFAYCAFGSVAGSFVHIWRAKVYEQDGVLGTFIVNAAMAFFLGQPACDLLPMAGLPMSFRNCAALSFSLGMLSPWILTTLAPMVGRKIASVIRHASLKSLVARLWGFKIEDDDDQGKPTK
jgi:hypothetical protein